MDMLVSVVSAICWLTVLVVWIVGALRKAAGNRPEPIRGSTDLTTSAIAFLASALVLLVGRHYAGNLTIDDAWERVPGLIVLVASTGFALWARLALGTSWSVGPVVAGDQRLRTTGPYAITRHPIYTGLLGMLVGTAMAAGLGQWAPLVPVGLIGMEAKIRMEERLLLSVFPEEYRQYRQRVPQLIPGLRLSPRD